MTDLFRKPFDPVLYNQYDEMAREAVRKMFSETVALTICQPESEYDVDYNIYRKGVLIGHLELEVKTAWIDKFPFQDIQFLERKIKYSRTLWVLFNKTCTQHFTIKVDDIKTCPTRIRPNVYSENRNEKFYVVPTSMINENGLIRFIEAEEYRQGIRTLNQP